MGTDDLTRWRDAILVDKDDALIGAAKRWLGPVRTPFNKHELIEKLEAFLHRPETAAAVVELLDRTDRRIVALALHAAARPEDGLPQAELARLAADDPAFEANALERVRNLKERLVLYSYRGPRGRDRIAVAPPLRARLLLEVPPEAALSTALPTAEPESGEPFAAFCSIVSACVHAKPAFKGRREPSKRAVEILDGAYPGLSLDKDRFEALLGALEAAGCFSTGSDGRPIAYPRRLVELCDAEGRAAPLALSAACTLARGDRGQETARHPYHGPSAAERRLAPGVMRAALELLPRGLAFSPADLRRLVSMATRRYLEPLADAGLPEAQEALDREGPGPSEALAEALGRLGFVVLGDDGLVRATTAVDSVLGPFPPSSSRPTVIVEESHEIRILPEAVPETRAFISAIARLDRTGLVWSATLDKAAAKSAYAYGFTAAELMDRLEALTGLPLPQSVRFSLGTWEAEARSARLRVGIVVALDGHLSGVLEHSPKAAGLVLERLAEGVYLLSASDAADAERKLKAAGIDVDMRPEPEDDGSVAAPLWDGARAPRAAADPVGPLAFRPVSDTLVPGDPPRVLALLSRLDELAPSPEERAELEKRIRARLVLDEAELKKPVAVADGSTASALDYPGKVRLLERALKDGAVVELSYTDADGKAATVSGVPRAIRRLAAGTVVALSTGAADQTVVPIGDIELARRA